MNVKSWTTSSSFCRVRSKLNGATNWTNFVHDEVDGMLLAEYTLISGTFTVKCLYTNGLGLISTNREGTKRYFHFDGSGSTWALSDENEVVKDNYSYTQTGVTVSATSTNGPSTNPRRFRGRLLAYDDGAMGSASNMVSQGHDSFSPSFGRYLQPTVRHTIMLYTPPPQRVTRRLKIQPGQSGPGVGFWWYGNYCGAANRKPPDSGFMPIDCLDSCCLIHDRCLEGHERMGYSGACQHKCCDCDLLHCAQGLGDCCTGACYLARDQLIKAFGLMCGAMAYVRFCPPCLENPIKYAYGYWWSTVGEREPVPRPVE